MHLLNATYLTPEEDERHEKAIDPDVDDFKEPEHSTGTVQILATIL